MKKALDVVALLVAVALVGAGCSSSNSSASKEPETVRPSIPIPADSPFAKVTVGMGMKEVTDTIGPPTDTDNQMTGKGFNPFYYGGDTHRVMYRYKGQGRIVFTRDHAFTSTMRVMEIQYDPTEKGYN